jgi:hypothetical protein
MRQNRQSGQVDEQEFVCVVEVSDESPLERSVAESSRLVVRWEV